MIATRDQASLAAVLQAMGLSSLNADETLVFTTQTVLYQKADGTIEARSPGGTAVELARKQDVDSIYNAIDGAEIVAQDGGAAFKTSVVTAMNGDRPYGTTVLKGE